jgi:hypothetical protein
VSGSDLKLSRDPVVDGERVLHEEDIA